jgi:peptide/nickel transport system substrate-binding protein
MARSIRALSVLTVGLLLLSASCTSNSSGPQNKKQVVEGGILRIGSISPIDTLNPFAAFQQNAFITFQYIYPYLVQYDSSLNPIGDFATKWERSADGLTYTFHTVPGATWSDGKPLSAEDAAWTITTDLKYAKGPTAAVAGSLAHVVSAVATDPNTLVVKYQSPVANALQNLQQVAILPEHIWSVYATGNGKGLKTFQNPAPVVSAGPFKLTEYKKDQVALFQANPNWYGKTKPHIQTFGIQFFSDQDAMIAALKSNQIDYVDVVPPTSVDVVKKAGFVVSVTPKTGLRDFIINSNPKKPKNRELLNPMVKEAFAHAIDRETIVKTAWLGYADPGDSLVPPAMGQWHDPSLKPETFDIGLANQLLDQAGYMKGADGIRVANGHKMAYTVVFSTDESGAGSRAFEIIQRDFRQIGVVLTQRNLDVNATFNAIIAPDGKYLNFDIAMWDWTVMPPDPDFILSVMTCGSWQIWNDSGYCDKSYDQMYQQQGAATSDAARKQIIYRMQEKIYNDRPYIILTYDKVIEAHSPSWAGFVPSPTGSINPYSKTTLLAVHRV